MEVGVEVDRPRPEGNIECRNTVCRFDNIELQVLAQDKLVDNTQRKSDHTERKYEGVKELSTTQ